MKVRLLLQIIRLDNKKPLSRRGQSSKDCLALRGGGRQEFGLVYLASGAWIVVRRHVPRDVESLRSSVGMHINMNLESRGWSVVLFEVCLLFAVFSAVSFVTSCLWIVRLHCM